jgi:small subunit ribosomal protein S2
MVDTNSNPKFVDFPIPANDDATKSITIILDQICDAIKEGLEERKNAKSADKEGAEVTTETVESVNTEASAATETTTEN